MTRKFYASCVGWPGRVQDLIDMIDSGREITRQVFLRNVDRKSLKFQEAWLGYESHPSRGLTMAGDWHVSYHSGTLRGQRVYWFCHSAIEYVFTPDETGE